VVASLEQGTGGSRGTVLYVIPMIEWLDGWNYMYSSNPFASSIVK